LTIIAPDLSSDAERLAIVVDHRVEIAHVNQVFKGSEIEPRQQVGLF
jgi:hypothetical protein